jgi:CIC family chloride channel protein
MRGLLRWAGGWLGGLPWRTLDRRALTFFLRLVPSEGQRVFALTILLGGLCGLAAVAFDLSIHTAEKLLIDRALAAPGFMWAVWALLVPTLGAAAAGALLTYAVPDARGSGVPQVKVAYLIKDGRMPFRVALGKFAICALQIGSGAALGREGPTVQICAGIASLLGRAAALSRRQQRMLLPVGAAAGIAAAFNAPLAAVTFTVEELVGELDQTLLAGIVVAAALAAVIERALLGGHPVLDVPAGYGLDHAESLPLYAGLGLAAALVSLVFTEALLRLRAGFARLRRVPPWLRPALGGLGVGALIIGARLGLGADSINGAGYAALGLALRGALPLKLLLALCALKLVATTLSYSSGGAGGIFAPSLFIGGMLGGSVGMLDVALFHHANAAQEIGSFALVGMGAVFAGVIRVPITSVLIIFEMTGSYGLILPLMIANMASYALARALRPVSIYEALLEQDGVQLPHQGQRPPHALELLRVGQAMTRAAVTLPAELSVDQALEQLPPQHFASYPVLAGERFCGLVSPARLRRLQAEGAGATPLGDVADRRAALRPDQPLLAALLQMERHETRQMAVLERGGPARLAGILTMSDLVRAQARAVRGDGPDSAALSEVRETLDDGPAFQRLRAFDGPPGAPPGPDDLPLHYQVVTLLPGAPAVGREVRALDLPPGVLLVTLDRGRQTLVPRGATLLAAGDRLTLFAPPEQMAAGVAALTGAPQRRGGAPIVARAVAEA